MSAGSAPVKDAPEPFSDAPDPHNTNPPSDFILRSSDNVDFHVHKQILAFVSVFFSNMFTFPCGESPPTEAQRDGKPVLHYSFAPEDLDSVCAVHEASKKYQFMHAEALILAALCTLKHPVQKLYDFHRLCGKEAQRIVAATAESTESYSVRPNGDPNLICHDENHNMCCWWDDTRYYEHDAKCGLISKELDLEFHSRLTFIEPTLCAVRVPRNKKLAKFGKQLSRSIDVSNMRLAKRAGVLSF
ncbi:hypothetical protein B0H11DRAFT_2076862 [Mycena galericulata]|nr:hypothetical protein B0H11DRAFT_2076862 [Mycena galericulata]